MIAMATFIEDDSDKDKWGYSYKLHTSAWVISFVGGVLNLVASFALA